MANLQTVSSVCSCSLKKIWSKEGHLAKIDIKEGYGAQFALNKKPAPWTTIAKNRRLP
jgi:hypothetical protein